MRMSGDMLRARRLILFASGLATICSLSSAWGQAPSILRRVGLLWLGYDNKATSLFHDSFRAAMAAKGWVEGQSIEYRSAYAEGQLDALDTLADRLVAQGVELIGAGTTPAIRATRNATTSLPIVMALGTSPVENSFVASLTRSEGSITDMTSEAKAVVARLIALLHETVPDATSRNLS